MTPTQRNLADRIAAAPWWKLRAGLVAIGVPPVTAQHPTAGRWIVGATYDGVAEIVWTEPGPGSPASDWWDEVYLCDPGLIPDLASPATGGVLLAMLPGHWRALHCSDGWEVSEVCGEIAGTGATLAEAAADALLIARGGP